MRRVQLIEWGIIAIALISGYKFFENLLSVFIQIIYGFDRHDLITDVFRSLLVAGLYAAAFIILIRNSDKVAVYINGTHSSEDTIPVKIGKRSMLQVILIAVCASTILSNIADVIIYLFEVFKKEVQRKTFIDDLNGNYPGPYNFILRSIQIIMAIIVIYFSKNISDLLIRKNEADDLVFDSKPEN